MMGLSRQRGLEFGGHVSSPEGKMIVAVGLPTKGSCVQWKVNLSGTQEQCGGRCGG